MSKKYCIEVLDNLGFAFSQKEYDNHETHYLGTEPYKLCYGNNDCIIYVPIDKFEIYDDKYGYYKKIED